MKNIISAPAAKISLKTNVKQGQAAIKKLLHVNCGLQNASHISAAFMGFKNANTVKGLSSNYYTASIAISSDTCATLDIGSFDNYSDAVNQFKSVVLSSDIGNVQWSLENDGTSLIKTTKKSECYYRYSKFTIETLSDEFVIKDETTDDEYKITQTETDTVGYSIQDTDSYLETIKDVFSSSSTAMTREAAKTFLIIDDLDDAFVLTSECSTFDVITESGQFDLFNEICGRLIAESIKNGGHQIAEIIIQEETYALIDDSGFVFKGSLTDCENASEGIDSSSDLTLLKQVDLFSNTNENNATFLLVDSKAGTIEHESEDIKHLKAQLKSYPEDSYSTYELTARIL